MLPGVENQPTSLEKSLQVRRDLARYWLSAVDQAIETSFSGSQGKLHHELLYSRIKSQPLSDEDASIVSMIMDRQDADLRKPGALGAYIAAMLYLPSHKVRIDLRMLFMPVWLHNTTWRYLLEHPVGFWEVGEVDEYAGYFEKLTAHIYEHIKMAPMSTEWQQVARLYYLHAHLIPMYFAIRSLKELYVQRAAIASFVLGLNPQVPEYEAPARTRNGKIRLGIILHWLHAHTETYATLPVFEHLDHDRFEIYLYVFNSDNNSVEQYCRGHADHFTILPQMLAEQAATIRKHELDILLFGTNTTAITNTSFQLACHRLARKQVSHFTCPCTTGLPHMDYFIAGILSETETAQQEYTEKLVQLDGTGLCFNYTFDKAPAQLKINRDIPEGTTLFVSGANYYKILPEVRETWARILAQVPDSVLMLYPFAPAWDDQYPVQQFIDNMKQVLARHGVGPDRLIVSSALPTQADIRNLVKVADVYLDSIPYSGATSLLDPLDVGTPIVTVAGPGIRFRQGAAILRDMGLDEMVVEDENAYVELALRIARDRPYRSALQEKIKLAMQAGPRFLDTRAYAGQMTALFTQILE